MIRKWQVGGENLVLRKGGRLDPGSAQVWEIRAVLRWEFSADTMPGGIPNQHSGIHLPEASNSPASSMCTVELGGLEAKKMAVLQTCFRKLMLSEENSVEVKGPTSSDKLVVPKQRKARPRNKEPVPGVVGEPGLRQTSCTPW